MPKLMTWSSIGVPTKTLVAGIALLVCMHFVIVRGFGLTPSQATTTKMWTIKRRVLRYANEHGELPQNLDHLPVIPDHINDTIDWWGNPIEFEVESNGTVILTSNGGSVFFYNPDEGKPIVVKFPSRSRDGQWSDELVDFVR